MKLRIKDMQSEIQEREYKIKLIEVTIREEKLEAKRHALEVRLNGIGKTMDPMRKEGKDSQPAALAKKDEGEDDDCLKEEKDSKPASAEKDEGEDENGLKNLSILDQRLYRALRKKMKENDGKLLDKVYRGEDEAPSPKMWRS